MNIRKYIYGITASVLMTTSLNAQVFNFDYDNGYYVKLYSGVFQIQDVGVSESASIFGLGISADYEWGFDNGWTVGTQLGYPIFNPNVPFVGNIRGEAEFSYSKAYYDDIDGTATLTYSDGSTVTITGNDTVNGKVEIVDFYNNFIYDVKDDGFVRPYAGIGIGFSYNEDQIEDIGGIVLGVMEMRTNYGAQIIIGADLINLGQNFSGGARFVARRVNSSETGVNDAEIISGQVDLRYNF